MPIIEISDEEYELRREGEILDRIHQAVVCGDEEEERRLEGELVMPAEILMHAKRVMGADWLRRQGYDMRRAEEVYGRDWLDR